MNINLTSTSGFSSVLQTFGFDDDEEYDVDDGGDDGKHSTLNLKKLAHYSVHSSFPSILLQLVSVQLRILATDMFLTSACFVCETEGPVY